MTWLTPMLCRCGPPPGECVADDEPISHYGELDSAGDCRHHNGPRAPKVPALSVHRGALTPAEACERVRGHVTDALLARTCVRHTTAGALRAAGFAVLHTPGRITAGPHCSVIYPAADPLRDQASPWPRIRAQGLRRVFQ